MSNTDTMPHFVVFFRTENTWGYGECETNEKMREMAEKVAKSGRKALVYRHCATCEPDSIWFLELKKGMPE